jgi:hypothetical protein
MDLQRIKQLLRATFREIRTIVASSAPEEVAALVNLQLVAFLPAATADDLEKARKLREDQR